MLETAHRALQNVGQVIRYTVATGRASSDPTQALSADCAPAGRLGFSGGRTALRPLSDAAIGAASLLHERLGFAPEIIEHQLAHAVPDALGRAYNRTRFEAERRRMMQAWADYLDALCDGARVIPLRSETRAG